MLLLILTLLTRVTHLILGVNTPQKYPPPLPAAEEVACFYSARDGDEKARQRLITHNLRLVSHIVRKYYSTAKNPEDLVSIGTVGLVKAVDSFRVENGAKFATYAAKCIQNEILMFFRAQKKTDLRGLAQRDHRRRPRRKSADVHRRHQLRRGHDRGDRTKTSDKQDA